MKTGFKNTFAALLAAILAVETSGCATRNAAAPRPPLPPAVFQPLQAALLQPYDGLFRTSPKLDFGASQIERMRDYLDRAEDHCTGRFKDRASETGKDLRGAQAELRRLDRGRDEERRQVLHCNIRNLRIKKTQADALARHAIPVAFDNRHAKLDLIERWPAELQRIRLSVETAAHRQRRYRGVRDIGFREIGKGQEDDVKRVEEAIREMSQSGMLPPGIGDEVVRDYVTGIARRIAARSDLRIPVNVTLLNSEEIDAVALPGGFLFVQRGVIEAVEDESQLAGEKDCPPVKRMDHEPGQRIEAICSPPPVT